MYADGLGETHFVVGMNPGEYRKYDGEISATSKSLDPSSIIEKVLFSPQDDIGTVLISFIEKESRSIKIAMYLFTDKKIAQALLDAAKRGVQIEVITDPCCLQNKFNKILMLSQERIPVWIYQSPDPKGNVMHNKFIVFGDGYIWTGSFNATQSAQQRNQENVIVLKDEWLMQTYSDQFEKIKNKCARLTSSNH